MGSTGVTPGLSRSTIAVQEVTGSHVLTVDGYTKTKCLAAGQFFRSVTFAAAGYQWSIKYYPNGCTAEDAGYISLFLELDQTTLTAPDVKARYSFSLLDTKGKPVTSYSYISRSTYSFFKGSPSRGWYQFIKAKVLEQSAYLCKDSFRVWIDITVLKETARYQEEAAAAPPTATRFVEVPPRNIDRHLSHLLLSGEGADVTFEVGEETVLAHRNILSARSPVFQAELFGPARGNNAMVFVWVEGIEAKVFRAMLHFVYTDSLPGEVEDNNETMKAMVWDLLVAADRYGLERLKLICEDKLCDCIDVSTIGTVFVLAERHDCHGLKKACIEFLMSGSNLEAAIVSGGFGHLANSCPSVLEELLAIFALSVPCSS
ncbi:unnamed protein product [Urochloa decumbens]|uniref:Uncharacterized protein n=1 Tax=Urochloa decumbens TaxID=240449 RepID=A0ABC9H289_9POAL